jgi:hypothetical protein
MRRFLFGRGEIRSRAGRFRPARVPLATGSLGKTIHLAGPVGELIVHLVFVAKIGDVECGLPRYRGCGHVEFQKFFIRISFFSFEFNFFVFNIFYQFGYFFGSTPHKSKGVTLNIYFVTKPADEARRCGKEFIQDGRGSAEKKFRLDFYALHTFLKYRQAIILHSFNRDNKTEKNGFSKWRELAGFISGFI